MRKRLVLIALSVSLCRLISSASPAFSKSVSDKLEEVKELIATQPNQSLVITNNLLELKELSKADLGEIYYQRGRIYFKGLHDKHESIINHYKALRYFRQLNDVERQYATLTYLGFAYKDLFRYDYALDYYNEILELDMNDVNSSLYTYYNIAKTLRLKGSYDSAITVHHGLIPSFKSRNMVEDLMKVYLELGACNIELGNWHEAQSSYEKVYQLASGHSQEQLYMAKAISSLGYVYLQLEELPLAQQYLNQSLPYLQQEIEGLDLAIGYNNLGMMALRLSNEQAARKYFLIVADLDPSVHNTQEVILALGKLVDLSKEIGELNTALKYSEQLTDVMNPFVELASKLEILHAQYKAETVHMQIQAFELQESLLKSKLKNTYIFIILALFCLVGGFLAYRINRMRKVDAEVIQYLKRKLNVT
ncbi:MAG: tetratricopeptide repeat protein [Cyclobacteriaceae bacterium]